ncbi:MAG: hypothetical protein WC055_00375 [Melioribacteraceae bacterium]
MSISELATGVYNYSQVASNFKTSINGRVYQVRAPQNPTYPFVIFFFPVDTITHFMNEQAVAANAVLNISLQFNIYSQNQSTSEINTIDGYLTDRFDFANLTVSGYYCFDLYRTHKIPPMWVEDIQGYISSVIYQVQLQKN